MEVAETLAANLFLQPSVVRCVVEYLLSTHTPLDELTDGYRRTRLNELESDTRTLADAFLRRPYEFELRAQVGVLARDPAARPRVQAVFHWLGPALAVPDTVFAEGRFAELVATTAAMAADPERFWTNVAHGGFLGHVVAQCFRFTDVLASAYSPPYMVAVMVDALLDALVAHIDPAQLRVHGELHVSAIGAGLGGASVKHLRPDEAELVGRIVALLKTGARDFAAVHAQIKTVVRNLGRVALASYAVLAEKNKHMLTT